MYLKHGDTYTRFYNIWYGMITRCSNPKKIYYKKGIEVCERWKNYDNFKEDMYKKYLDHCNEYGEKDTSIDRIDVYGNYEPNNCRWATNKEQSLNRTSNTIFTIEGQDFTMSQLCEIYDIKTGVFIQRLKLGWNINEILSTPTKSGMRRNKVQQQITYKGLTKTIKEWSEITNLSPTLIRNRLNRGWSIDRALNFYNIEEEI